MKKISILFCIVAASLLFLITMHGDRSAGMTVAGTGQKALNSTGFLRPAMDSGRTPLYFMANRGQVDTMVKFYARASGYTLWLTPESLVFDSFKRMKPDTDMARDVSRLVFVGANKNPGIEPVTITNARVNFFIGNDPDKWYANVPTYLAVLYKDIYKKIDLEVYGVEKQIQYDWVIKPGGNPGDIRFEYRDVKHTRIDRQGNLVINTANGEWVHLKPVCFQVIDNRRRPVSSGFKRVSKNVYGFSVGRYDKDHTLIIDPVVLAYSTYLGGTAADYGRAIAADSNGNVYVTGFTSSTNFPVHDQYQSEPGDSNTDVFVTKLDTTVSGTYSLVYSTYLGGSSNDEGHGIAIDWNGFIYVTGYTNSANFPTKNQYQTNQDGEDGFVVKLDPTQAGADSLLFATYLCGSSADRGYAIAADSSGHAYITGWTDSSNFPIKNQYQSNKGGRDVFVTRLDTTQSGTASLVYSTYLGGSSYNSDEGYGIAADSSGNAYVTGCTSSYDFPAVNQYQSFPFWDDETCAFVSRIDTNLIGTPGLIYSTCLGGSENDKGLGIACDNDGQVYVTGYTNSSNFPIKNQYQSNPGGCDAFISKFDTYLAGSASLLYSTYLGSGGYDEGSALAIDLSGKAYMTGYTSGSDFPVRDAVQVNQDGDDAVLSVVDTTKTGNASLVYSTYLGGNGSDYGRGIAIDNNNNVYLTGNTTSVDFPLVNHYQANPDSSTNDAFVAKFAPPALMVTAPNGGESFQVDSVQNITWTSDGVGGNVMIEYSINDGANWTQVIASTENDGVYAWTVPETPSLQCLVRVSDIDGIPSDTSNANFSIVPVPTLELLAPNGGEAWEVGSSHAILWTGTWLKGDVKIDYSTSNGISWINIVPFTDNDGIFNWIIPNTPSATCLVRVSLTEGDTGLLDSGNEVFSIIPDSGPIVTVIFPNGGEKLTVGTIQSITWSDTGISGNVNLEYSTNEGQTWQVIQSSVVNNGRYNWTIPNTPSNKCLVRVGELDGDPVDSSNVVFSILSPDNITVTVPVGGEAWEAGTTHAITWAGGGGITDDVKIDYSTNNGSTWSNVIPLTDNDGLFNWQVPNTPSTNCRIRISSSDPDTGQADISDGIFSIISPSGPTVTVTSPNGKEKLAIGEVWAITWTDTGISGNVKIEYSINKGQTWEIIQSSFSNSGRYNWTVPNMPSAKCLVRVGELDGDPQDISDEVFYIAPNPAITVTSPNGGESWQVGSSHSITWTSTGIKGDVKLEYSTNNGISWITITPVTDNDGIQTWTIPDAISGTCLIRVKEVDRDDGVFDVSNAVFSITPPGPPSP